MRKDSKRDIAPLLAEWPFQSGTINARLILGADNLPYVQVRLDLGLLQMRADGRPDGARPQGFESWLEFFEAKLESHESEIIDSDNPTHEPVRDITLSSEECRLLRDEAAQYYQRYVACLTLEDFDRVIRDTTRNLRVLNVCSTNAEQENDRVVLEQFRAYVMMIRARALASQMIKDNEIKAAVLVLDEALASIRTLAKERGREEGGEDSHANEIEMLQAMRDALAPKLPVSLKAELKARLQRAIDTENYELAAILRDELKQLEDGSRGA